MKLKYSFAGLVLLSTAFAYANTAYQAQSGFYLTADGGYGTLTTPDATLNTSTGSYDRTGLVWSAGAGYAWAMDSYTLLGLEADYLDNGQSAYTGNGSGNGNLNISSNAFAIAGMFNSAWSNGFNVFAKAGVADVQQVGRFTQATTVNGYTRWGNSFGTSFQFLGVLGAGYYLTNSINLFLDYTYLSGNGRTNWDFIDASGAGKSNSDTAAASQFKLGLSYAF